MDGQIISLINGGGGVAVAAFLFYFFIRLEKALQRLHERMDSIERRYVDKEDCKTCNTRVEKIEQKYEDAITFLRVLEDRFNRGLTK